MKSGVLEGAEYAFGVVLLPEGWLFPTSSLAVQLVDPGFVYGEKHLLASIYSHLKGLRLAKDPKINLLLRITGIKQIKEAMNAKPKDKAVLVVVGEGAAKEYKKLLASLKSTESGEVKTRPDEMDAIERSALVGV